MQTAAQTQLNDPMPHSMPMSDEQRLKQFGAALDQIRKRIENEIGDTDVKYIKKMRNTSRALEVLGRGLIHISLEPIGFSTGVIALWLHKQLEATEIGHMALHGCYDGLEGAEAFQSKTFNWRVPIDERSWHVGHNQKHHQYTNIAGKDPDIHFGPVRLTDKTKHNWLHQFQLPLTLGTIFPAFTFGMNMHFTGLVDVYSGKKHKLDVLPDLSWRSIAMAHMHALRKYVPYYAREYVFFPALAGPFFLKVAAGNLITEMMRDIYSAATIFCGHVGEETASYPEGARAHGRGQWYAMQVASANNFKVPPPISILCGALDLQIEHHLFPKFPPNRLREIQPEVEAVCKEFGVEYRMESWPKTLKKAFRHIQNLSADTKQPFMARIGHILEDMA